MASPLPGIPPAPRIEGAEHVHSGKVRDLYRLPDGNLLMVASDRISAYDFVLDSTIPDKGVVLTQMSLWWFEQLADLVPNHVVSTDVPEQVRGRAVVWESLEMEPVVTQCSIARGGAGRSVARRSAHSAPRLRPVPAEAQVHADRARRRDRVRRIRSCRPAKRGLAPPQGLTWRDAIT